MQKSRESWDFHQASGMYLFTSLPLSGSTGFVLVRVGLMGHGQLVPPQRYSDNVSLA